MATGTCLPDSSIRCVRHVTDGALTHLDHIETRSDYLREIIVKRQTGAWASRATGPKSDSRQIPKYARGECLEIFLLSVGKLVCLEGWHRTNAIPISQQHAGRVSENCVLPVTGTAMKLLVFRGESDEPRKL